jgi:hypothetical protein
MDEWDPVPQVNAVFKGVIAALLIMGVLFCLIGIAATALSLARLVLS